MFDERFSNRLNCFRAGGLALGIRTGKHSFFEVAVHSNDHVEILGQLHSELVGLNIEFLRHIEEQTFVDPVAAECHRRKCADAAYWTAMFSRSS